jgi:hypothetical protein
MGTKGAMQSVTLKFHIIIYPSEEADARRFTAHCLNLDLVADDDTIEGAVSSLLETIEAQLEASAKYETNPFRDAPRHYWDLLQRCKELPKELRERIVFNANKRRAGGRTPQRINVESQCDLRQLQPA